MKKMSNPSIENDYLDPSKFGPVIWNSWHMMASLYSQNPTTREKSSYRQYYSSFLATLPCKDPCLIHFVEFWKLNPLNKYLSDGYMLSLWVLLCHNYVNKLLNRREWSPKELFEKYPITYNLNHEIPSLEELNKISKKNELPVKVTKPVVVVKKVEKKSGCGRCKKHK